MFFHQPQLFGISEQLNLQQVLLLRMCDWYVHCLSAVYLTPLKSGFGCEFLLIYIRSPFPLDIRAARTLTLVLKTYSKANERRRILCKKSLLTKSSKPCCRPWTKKPTTCSRQTSSKTDAGIQQINIRWKVKSVRMTFFTKPVDAIIAGMRPLSPVIDNLADTFSALPKIRSNTDREKLKTELRPHIDRLEELFKQI